MDDNEDDGRYPSNPYDVGHQTGYSSSKHQKVTIGNIPYSRSIENQYVDDEEEGEDDEDLGEEEENPYDVGHQTGYSSSKHQKVTIRNTPYSRPIENQYVDDAEGKDDEDLGEEEENRNENNGVRYVGNHMDDIVDDEDDNEELDDGNEDDDDYNENEDHQKGYDRKKDDVDFKRHLKKRRLKNLLPSYEFAPRDSAPAGSAPSVWTERETFVLLDACSDIFLRRGRKSLRSKELEEVAKKVSEVSKIERTGTQCRNRLHTLKKKHKKGKAMLAETGVISSKWIYFEKMEIIMSTPQQGELSSGLDSGEYAFMNCDNDLDEMRDGLADSEYADDEEDDSDGVPPKKRKIKRRYDEDSSFGLIADVIQKFSDIYERTEKNKMKKMLELEKMRMDFHTELEKQKQQMMDRAQAEIAKIHQQADNDKNEIAKIHQQSDDDKHASW